MFIGFLVSELIGRTTFSLFINYIPTIEGKQILMQGYVCRNGLVQNRKNQRA